MRLEPRPGLDTTVFTNVIETGDVVARGKLAQQLADFLTDPGVSEAERNQVVPAVLKLSVDPVKDIRRSLAQSLQGFAGLHADVVFSIIADDDDIALPFLRETPALSHWHMLAVLRVGDELRQEIIARRPDLSAEAMAYMVRAASLEVCMALFKNPTVRFDDRAYHTLYERFGSAADLVELLLGRADLPLDIRILQAKFASNRMRQLMAERGWVAVSDASQLVEDAEETAILRILVEASQAELAQAIPFLVNKKLLTPSLIVRAAAIGEMKVVHWSLAHLAGVSLPRASDMMFGRGLMGLRSLHGKAGLPPSCYWLLQAACDVVKDGREEGIALEPESFGRRLIEALMTRYENMLPLDRAKNLDLVGRYAEDRVRTIAKRLRADMVRAA
jgi:uncharacterized protein (DUF2336 family)